MDVQLFIAQSVEGLRAQMEAHRRTWHLDKASNWSVDQDLAEITFTLGDGVTARAAVQIVGTYNTLDGTFLWAWDHPSVLEPLRRDALLAKAWGEEHHIAPFIERKVVCPEDKGWEFTAVAARLAGANGAYRGPSSSARVFMTFGQIVLSRQ